VLVRGILHQLPDALASLGANLGAKQCISSAAGHNQTAQKNRPQAKKPVNDLVSPVEPRRLELLTPCMPCRQFIAQKALCD